MTKFRIISKNDFFKRAAIKPTIIKSLKFSWNGYFLKTTLIKCIYTNTAKFRIISKDDFFKRAPRKPTIIKSLNFSWNGYLLETTSFKCASECEDRTRFDKRIDNDQNFFYRKTVRYQKGYGCEKGGGARLSKGDVQGCSVLLQRR